MPLVLRAYAGALVILIIPGVLVAAILGLRFRVLSTWAIIPAFSLALVFLLGEVTMVGRVSFGLPAFALLLVVLIVLLAAMRSRQHVAAPPPDGHLTGAPREPLATRVEYLMLAAGVAIGTSIWYRGLRGLPLVVPGTDANRHGWFVARIIFGHSIDPARVLTSDVGGDHPIAHYYPLALHASAALSTRIFGSDVARVLVAYTVLFSAVVLPIGMFLLARALAPSLPLVAGFTAIIVPLLLLYPYFPIRTGDVPQVIAMALVPVCVALLQRAMLAKDPPIRPTRAFAVALVPPTLAVFCIAALHTSELPLIVFLVLLVVVECTLRTRDARVLMPALERGMLIGASVAILFAPTLVMFTHGVSERVPVRSITRPLGWGPSLRAVLQLEYGPGTVRQGFLAVLAIAGAAVWLMRRRPAWVVGWFTVVLLTLFADSSTSGLRYQLTFPWYHFASRVAPNVAFFVPFFAGVTLAYGVAVVVRISRRSWAALPATVAMLAVLAQFAGVHGFRAARDYVHTNFDPNSVSLVKEAVVAESSLAAFRFLHDHAARGDTVANEPNVDGSLWMYALQHVSPLTGPYDKEITPELADRLYLTAHLQALGRDARADALARRYQTRWIFFDTHQFVLARRAMRLAQMQQNRHLRAVFHEDGTWVFRIDLG